MSLKFVFIFLSSTCIALMAQDSGTAVLRRVAEAYMSLRSESVEATVVMEMKTYRIETSIVGAIAKPGKVRFEVINSMMGSQTISDGQSIWKYVASFGQYTRRPVSPGIFPIAEGPADIFTGERVMNHLQSAKLLRREKLTVNGKPVDCDVIKAAYSLESSKAGVGRIKTFWVDVHRAIILKVSSLISIDPLKTGGTPDMAQSVTVTSITYNEPLKASLFVFVPPDGVKEVSELLPPGRKSQNGHKVEIEERQ